MKLEQEQEQNHKQKIVRKVTTIGNGAHVFIPKEWLGDEVVLVRKPKLDIKKEILKKIYPHLDKVIAVGLFGSYSRGKKEKILILMFSLLPQRSLS